MVIYEIVNQRVKIESKREVAMFAACIKNDLIATSFEFLHQKLPFQKFYPKAKLQ